MVFSLLLLSQPYHHMAGGYEAAQGVLNRGETNEKKTDLVVLAFK